MTSKLVLATPALAALLATGCSSMSAREQGTAQGAGIGALAGATLGSPRGERPAAAR